MKRIVIILVAVSLAGLFTYRFLQARETVPANADAALMVRTAPVELRDVPRHVGVTGTIRADNEVDVAAKIGGRVATVRVDVGDEVDEGQVLMELETTELRLQVQQAEAALASARASQANAAAEYERAVQMRDAGGSSSAQVDRVRLQRDASNAQEKQAIAQLALARESLDNASVRAPIGGVITRRSVSRGQMIGAGVPLFHLQDAAVVRFGTAVDARTFHRLARDGEVEVQVEAFPDKVFAGRVTRLSPQLDPGTRRASIEIEIDNAAGELLPNMFARGRMAVGVEEQARVVPYSSLHEEGHTQFIYVVKDDVLERRQVRAEHLDRTETLILEGVEAGEMVVTSGGQRLRDGARVLISD